MITGRFEAIEVAWGRVAPIAMRRLERRGVSSSDAEDAVQEAVVRALSTGVTFDSEEHSSLAHPRGMAQRCRRIPPAGPERGSGIG